MAETSDTSAIDEKKETNKTNKTNKKNTSTNNIVSFVFKVFVLFLIVLAYFGWSGLILYMCKLAQSNILPTNERCFPYTDKKLTQINEIETNIFPTTSEESKTPLSMKMRFPYAGNTKEGKYNEGNQLIDILRKYKNRGDSNFIANYLISIIEPIISFNYTSFTYVFNMLNGFPELFVVVFGPIIVGIITGILFACDWFYSIWLWFVNMSWFFKTNENETGTGKPQWVDVTLISPFNYGSAIGLIILFSILFFLIGIGGLLPVLSFVLVAYCLLSCLSYKSIFNNEKSNAFTILLSVLKYYKNIVMLIFCIFVLSLVFSMFGTYSGVISMAIIGLIYSGMLIHSDIFKSKHQENLTPLVSYEKATKNCIENEPKQDTWFGNGGSFIKQLKKFSKKYSPK